MKFIKQFAIILLISFLGQLLSSLIPLPIPATVWGMCLMFAALATHILKLSQVEETADFFVAIIAVMFVPYGVSLMSSYSLILKYVIPILVIVAVSYFVCFTVTGKTADFIISRKKAKEEIK